MSRQYFDFSDLIGQYENPFVVITHEKGGYDAKGDYVAQQEKRETLHGAIIAFKESKVFRSEGKITTQDRRLFMLEALPAALMGAQVEYDGQLYRIESETENAEFTGVYSYLLKWVSAFDCV